MDIRELKYIDMIARTRHMSKAAEGLYISVPALHKTLQKVESEVNAKLFYRNGHELLPTDIGEIVLEYAHRIFDAMVEMDETISETQNLRKGNVSIGFPSVVGTLYLPNVLINFQKNYPNILLKTIEGGADDLCKMVETGRLDTAIVVRPVYSQNLNEIPVLRDQVVAGVNHQHPWAERPYVTLKDFENVSFNTFGEGHTVYTHLMDKFKEAKIFPNLGFCGTSSEFLYEITSLSNGILVLPKPIIESLCGGQMKMVPFKPVFSWELCLVFRKNAYLSMAAKTLIEYIQKHFLLQGEDPRD